ncbi:hypothetical protein OAL14_00365 [Gammaproteobacteria bacterium]|nr:hypothetical protein [Gammaproteobacteria bacterium]
MTSSEDLSLLKIIKANIVVFLVFLLIVGATLEITMRIAPSFFFEKNIRFLPNTHAKSEILRELGIIDLDSQKVLRTFSGVTLPIYLSSFKDFPSKEDRDFGATSVRYYNEGFCNLTESISEKEFLAIGNSFTYCLSVNPEDSWIYEAFYTGDKSRVFNAGYPGVGPPIYNEILKELISPRTKLVVYAYYEGNDFRDMVSVQNIVLNTSPEAKNWLKENLGDYYLLNFLYALYQKTGVEKTPLTDNVEDFRYTVEFNGKKIQFNTNNSDRGEIKSARSLHANDPQDEINGRKFLRDRLNFYFSEAGAIARKNGSEILFLYLPSAYSAFGPEKVTFNVPGLSKLMFDFSRINRSIFSEVCVEKALNCIDVTKVMIEKNSALEIPTHFPTNLHLTGSGHSIVGNEIKTWYSKNIQMLGPSE